MMHFFQRIPASASDDGRGRLTLRSVALEDAGDYICSVVDVAGTFQTTARLEVDYSKSSACNVDDTQCIRAVHSQAQNALSESWSMDKLVSES